MPSRRDVIPIRRTVALLSLALIGLVLLSGCLDAQPVKKAPSSPPEIIIDYTRTGGIAGLDDRMVIFDNGLTLISGRDVSTEITLTGPELERIAEVFTTAGFVSLEDEYTSRRSGADVIVYHITYAKKTVTFEETVAPPALAPVIVEMDRILSLGTGNHSPVSTLPSIG